MSSVTVRRSIRTSRSIIGRIKTIPGPRYGVSRPNRNTTPRSYSLRIRMLLRRNITRIKTSTPIPGNIAFLPAARLTGQRARRIRTSNDSLHFQLEPLDCFDPRPRARDQRLTAHRAPDFAVHKNLARRARRDRLAHLAHFSQQTFRPGLHGAPTLARHDISERQNYQR